MLIAKAVFTVVLTSVLQLPNCDLSCKREMVQLPCYPALCHSRFTPGIATGQTVTSLLSTRNVDISTVSELYNFIVMLVEKKILSTLPCLKKKKIAPYIPAKLNQLSYF